MYSCMSYEPVQYTSSETAGSTDQHRCGRDRSRDSARRDSLDETQAGLMGWLSVECPFELRFDIDSTHDGELAMHGGAAQGGRGETGVATVHATKGDDVWAIGRFIDSSFIY